MGQATGNLPREWPAAMLRPWMTVWDHTTWKVVESVATWRGGTVVTFADGGGERTYWPAAVAIVTGGT